MQTALNSPFSFTPIDAGVDWITCTARGRDARKGFKAQAEAILQEEAGRGVLITPARLRDYVGYRAPGVIVGGRRDDDIVVLSGAHAARLWKTVAQHATNVSRLDLQVTLWTHGEQPALSRWYYAKLKRLPPQRGRPRSFSLIQTHPQGDTLYVGKRQSDYFGRCYDYAAAHTQGAPRTIWRFEVECKRHLAANHSRALLVSSDDRVESNSIVHDWFSRRGCRLPWALPDFAASQQQAAPALDRDTLAWFKTSLSKTVATAVRRHGLDTVLDALGLSGLVMARPPKGGNAYATLAASALPLHSGRGAARSVDADNLSLQGGDLFARFNSKRRDE